MRSNNDQRCTKRQVVHRSKEQSMTNDLGQGVNNKLVLTDSGILRYDVRCSLAVITATTTAVSSCLSLWSFLSTVSMSATTTTTVRLRCRCRRSLGLMSVPTAATASVRLGCRRCRSSLFLLSVAATTATAAALRGGGRYVNQLELLSSSRRCCLGQSLCHFVLFLGIKLLTSGYSQERPHANLYFSLNPC